MYRILIVEDDDALASGMEKQILMWGLEPKRVENFSDIMDEFHRFSPPE